jgi:hypothetical protein
MRKGLILCFAVATTSVPFGATTAGHATEQPWCIVFGGSQGPIENCGMRTFEMCRQEAIAGNRGSCFFNPYYSGDWPQRSGTRHRNW